MNIGGSDFFRVEDFQRPCPAVTELHHFQQPSHSNLTHLIPEVAVTVTSLEPEVSNPSTVSRNPQRASHEPHDVNEPYTTSLQQRQQQAQAYYTSLERSQLSSSSGSTPRALRRTPHLGEQRPTRLRSSSADSPQRAQQNVRFADDQFDGAALSRQRAQSQDRASDPRPPHPIVRISRRTASAILYALEEAIRTPYPFTPDLDEENASMSDLLRGGNGGRTANGGASAASAGPVPAQQAPPSGVRTPRDIMARRQEREAAKAEEQRRQQEEERRRSAQARVSAAGVAGTTTQQGTTGYRAEDVGGGGQPSQYQTGATPRTGASGTYPGTTPGRPPDSGYAQGTTTTPRDATGRRVASGPAPATQPVPATPGRTRGSSVSQGQPQPANPQQTPQTSRRPPQSQTRDPGNPTAQQPPGGALPQTSATGGLPSTDPSQGRARQSTTSSFPHAFERWETLSSYWEGLTSYWIRRLEQNNEELKREPLGQQMSRQIQDLSAAGANLFHAVVELQRLRASSERKFQRWFFETRAEQERAQEAQAEMENSIRMERAARAEMAQTLQRTEQERIRSDKMVAEMRRELLISKEEARRAWEELGRREQEERERTLSLRDGQPTLVGGVQVVPMATDLSRGPSMSQRPGTSGYQAGPTQEQYGYEEQASPTDTDPFIEVSRTQHHLHREPDVPSLAVGTYQPYPQTTSAGTTSSTKTTVPSIHSQAPPPAPAPLRPTGQSPTSQPYTSAPPAPTNVPTTNGGTSAPFYRQQDALLHSSQPPPPAPQAPTSHPRTETAQSGSYVPSLDEPFSDEGDEYEMDSQGNVRFDAQGNPIVARRTQRYGIASPGTQARYAGGQLGLSAEDDDEYDVAEDIAREARHRQTYGVPTTTTTAAGTSAGPSSSSAAAVAGAGGAASYTAMTTSGAYTQQQGQTQTSNAPDYSGSGYGGWEGLQRHHHPTRLSDVLEEDERSRTSPSRGSLVSRGY